MSIPKFEDLFEPTIKALRLAGGTADIYKIEEVCADQLGLTDEEQNQIHSIKEGNRTELGYRLAWARNYLKHAGLIENVERTVWGLTEEGERITSIDKDHIKSLVSGAEIEKAVGHSDIQTDDENENIEFEDSSAELAIGEPFDPKKVDVTSKQMILDVLFKRLKNQEIDLLTGFQRKGGLWNRTKQSRLIESILIRFPLPAFYFDGSDDDKWLIVDGLQRLTSLKSFVLDKTLTLDNMEFLYQFNGYKFSDLPRDLQRRIEEFEIVAYIINPGTPEKVKYNVFKRINTGGLVLSAQEIRHALNQGKAALFMEDLANLKEFKVATTYSINPERMQDRDFANRFVAFYLTPVEEYKPDLDTFLNDAMASLNTMPDSELESIKLAFGKAMSTAYEIFGSHSFRKIYDYNERRKPINKALFEVWSVLLAKRSVDELQILVRKKSQVIEDFIELMNEDRQFNKSISSGTGGSREVRTRFKEINNIITEIIES